MLGYKPERVSAKDNAAKMDNSSSDKEEIAF
jgi:hypothetical protein